MEIALYDKILMKVQYFTVTETFLISSSMIPTVSRNLQFSKLIRVSKSYPDDNISNTLPRFHPSKAHFLTFKNVPLAEGPTLRIVLENVGEFFTKQLVM